MRRLDHGRRGTVTRVLSMLLIVTGSVLLALGLLAGVVNHEVLDGPRFARHMDAVRREPAVAQQIGTAITNQLIAVDPNIVAVRPLLDAATTSLVSSQAFGPIFRAAVRDLHATFTGGGSGQVALRLADVGAVLAGVLPTISPSAAARVPPDLDVTLSRIGSGSFAARSVRLAHIAGILSWLLPVLALLALAAGWWLAPGPRRRQSSRIAWAVTWSGVALCNRPYNQVAYPATHNAMSAADEPGWFIPEQPDGLIGQLNAGIRVLLIASWYGQATTRPGLVATAPGSHAAALADAQREFGPAAVASFLRLHNAIAPTPTGPVLPYLCHSLCEIGSTEWEPVMAQVQAWLVAHPREVVTFFIEDRVSPADTATVFFREAGLLPYVYQPRAGGSWPTLGQMIDSGHRVVTLMENHDGGTTYPWLMRGFHWVQDTPFGSPTAADLSCARNRGATSSPILLINYWLTNDYRSLVTDARAINSYDMLSPFVARCQTAARHAAQLCCG